MKFTYDSSVAIDPATKRFSNFIERVIWAATPGSYLVDFFTWMKYLPNLISPWKRQAQAHYEADNAYFTDLYLKVKKSVVSTVRYLFSLM